MDPIEAAVGGAGGALASAVAAAPVVLDPAGAADPLALGLDVAARVFAAVQAGNYALAGALGVVAVCWVLRRYGARWLPWLATDAGGAVLVLGTAVAGTFVAATAGGASITVDVVRRALEVGFTAAGGYATVKKIGAALWTKITAAPPSTPSVPPATPPVA
jgi:hypothetical protein